jgi:hypothetical protein
MGVRSCPQRGLTADAGISDPAQTSVPHVASMKPCSPEHQDDVRDQLEETGRMFEAWGVGSTVRPGRDRVTLELAAPEGDDAVLSIVAAFNDGGVIRAGWENWLQLRIESGGEPEVLLTLAWLEGRDTDIDASLPLDQRGLNAIADVRERRLARGDVLTALVGEVKARAGDFSRANAAQALTVRVRNGRPERISDTAHRLEQIIAEFEPATAEGEMLNPAFAVRVRRRRTPSLEELNERLIGEILEALQRELVQKDAQFARAGMHSTAKGRLAEALEWAVLAVCYAVESKTNQLSMASIMGEGGSWLFGLIGPVVIGWLASLGFADTAANKNTEKQNRRAASLGKFAGVGLIASWALTMAMITASNPDYVKRAQAWFPKLPAVVAHEKALAVAKLDIAAAEREVQRLEGQPGANTAALIAGAKKRWQAKELEAMAAAERERGDAALAAAIKALKDAQATLSGEEFARDQALLTDPSAAWAWRSAGGILFFINLIVPLAVAWIVERFRRDHAAAKEKAQADHVLGEEARFLRQGRPAQKARAIQLLTDAMDRLEREGVPVEMLNRLEGANLAETVTGRFDRIVNAQKFRRRFRLFGPSQN